MITFPQHDFKGDILTTSVVLFIRPMLLRSRSALPEPGSRAWTGTFKNNTYEMSMDLGARP